CPTPGTWTTTLTIFAIGKTPSSTSPKSYLNPRLTDLGTRRTKRLHELLEASSAAGDWRTDRPENVCRRGSGSPPSYPLSRPGQQRGWRTWFRIPRRGECAHKLCLSARSDASA